jgi:hypothetical protein
LICCNFFILSLCVYMIFYYESTMATANARSSGTTLPIRPYYSHVDITGFSSPTNSRQLPSKDVAKSSATAATIQTNTKLPTNYTPNVPREYPQEKKFPVYNPDEKPPLYDEFASTTARTSSSSSTARTIPYPAPYGTGVSKSSTASSVSTSNTLNPITSSTTRTVPAPVSQSSTVRPSVNPPPYSSSTLPPTYTIPRSTTSTMASSPSSTMRSTAPSTRSQSSTMSSTKSTKPAKSGESAFSTLWSLFKQRNEIAKQYAAGDTSILSSAAANLYDADKPLSEKEKQLRDEFGIDFGAASPSSSVVKAKPRRPPTTTERNILIIYCVSAYVVFIFWLLFIFIWFGPALTYYNKIVNTTCMQYNTTTLTINVPPTIITNPAVGSVVAYTFSTGQPVGESFNCGWNICDTKLYRSFHDATSVYKCLQFEMPNTVNQSSHPIYLNAYNDYLVLYVVVFVLLLVFFIPSFCVTPIVMYRG